VRSIIEHVSFNEHGRIIVSRTLSAGQLRVPERNRLQTQWNKRSKNTVEPNADRQNLMALLVAADAIRCMPRRGTFRKGYDPAYVVLFRKVRHRPGGQADYCCLHHLQRGGADPVLPGLLPQDGSRSFPGHRQQLGGQLEGTSAGSAGYHLFPHNGVLCGEQGRPAMDERARRPLLHRPLVPDARHRRAIGLPGL
jgi:hypothetical protein